MIVGPWAPHNSGMRGYAQKFIEYSPGGVPGVGPRAQAFEPSATEGMKLGVSVGGANQHVGVDGKHCAKGKWCGSEGRRPQIRHGCFRNVSDVYISRFSGKLGCREQDDLRAALYLRGGNSL